jgi:Ca2+-binding EF-hand superfamily protein
VDGSGTIDKYELKELLEQLCVPMTDEELGQLLHELDRDKSQQLTFEEFYQW